MTVPLDGNAQKRLAEAGLTPYGSGVQRPASKDHGKFTKPYSWRILLGGDQRK